jgi:hypothetical protein
MQQIIKYSKLLYSNNPNIKYYTTRSNDNIQIQMKSTKNSVTQVWLPTDETNENETYNILLSAQNREVPQ